MDHLASCLRKDRSLQAISKTLKANANEIDREASDTSNWKKVVDLCIKLLHSLVSEKLDKASSTDGAAVCDIVYFCIESLTNCQIYQELIQPINICKLLYHVLAKVFDKDNKPFKHSMEICNHMFKCLKDVKKNTKDAISAETIVRNIYVLFWNGSEKVKDDLDVSLKMKSVAVKSQAMTGDSLQELIKRLSDMLIKLRKLGYSNLGSLAKFHNEVDEIICNHITGLNMLQADDESQLNHSGLLTNYVLFTSEYIGLMNNLKDAIGISTGLSLFFKENCHTCHKVLLMLTYVKTVQIALEKCDKKSTKTLLQFLTQASALLLSCEGNFLPESTHSFIDSVCVQYRTCMSKTEYIFTDALTEELLYFMKKLATVCRKKVTLFVSCLYILSYSIEINPIDLNEDEVSECLGILETVENLCEKEIISLALNSHIGYVMHKLGAHSYSNQSFNEAAIFYKSMCKHTEIGYRVSPDNDQKKHQFLVRLTMLVESKLKIKDDESNCEDIIEAITKMASISQKTAVKYWVMLSKNNHDFDNRSLPSEIKGQRIQITKEEAIEMLKLELCFLDDYSDSERQLKIAKNLITILSKNCDKADTACTLAWVHLMMSLAEWAAKKPISDVEKSVEQAQNILCGDGQDLLCGDGDGDCDNQSESKAVLAQVIIWTYYLKNMSQDCSKKKEKGETTIIQDGRPEIDLCLHQGPIKTRHMEMKELAGSLTKACSILESLVEEEDYVDIKDSVINHRMLVMVELMAVMFKLRRKIPEQYRAYTLMSNLATYAEKPDIHHARAEVECIFTLLNMDINCHVSKCEDLIEKLDAAGRELKSSSSYKLEYTHSQLAIAELYMKTNQIAECNKKLSHIREYLKKQRLTTKVIIALGQTCAMVSRLYSLPDYHALNTNEHDKYHDNGIALNASYESAKCNIAILQHISNDVATADPLTPIDKLNTIDTVLTLHTQGGTAVASASFVRRAKFYYSQALQLAESLQLTAWICEIVGKLSLLSCQIGQSSNAQSCLDRLDFVLNSEVDTRKPTSLPTEDKWAKMILDDSDSKDNSTSDSPQDGAASPELKSKVIVLPPCASHTDSCTCNMCSDLITIRLNLQRLYYHSECHFLSNEHEKALKIVEDGLKLYGSMLSRAVKAQKLVTADSPDVPACMLKPVVELYTLKSNILTAMGKDILASAAVGQASSLLDLNKYPWLVEIHWHVQARLKYIMVLSSTSHLFQSLICNKDNLESKLKHNGTYLASPFLKKKSKEPKSSESDGMLTPKQCADVCYAPIMGKRVNKTRARRAVLSSKYEPETPAKHTTNKKDSSTCVTPTYKENQNPSGKRNVSVRSTRANTRSTKKHLSSVNFGRVLTPIQVNGQDNRSESTSRNMTTDELEDAWEEMEDSLQALKLSTPTSLTTPSKPIGKSRTRNGSSKTANIEKRVRKSKKKISTKRLAEKQSEGTLAVAISNHCVAVVGPHLDDASKKQVEKGKSTLTEVLKSLEHFPQYLLYRDVCQALGILHMVSDVELSAHFFSESSAINNRHHGLLNLYRKTKRLEKSLTAQKQIAQLSKLKDMVQITPLDRKPLDYLPKGSTVVQLSVINCVHPNYPQLLLTRYRSDEPTQIFTLKGFGTPRGQELLSDFEKIFKEASSSIGLVDGTVWWDTRYALDSRLGDVLKQIENTWFGIWKKTLLGQWVDDEINQVWKECSDAVIESEGLKATDTQWIQVLIDSAQQVSEEDKDEDMMRGVAEQMNLDINDPKVSKVYGAIQKEGKKFSVDSGDGSRQGVILITDKGIHNVSFESMPIVRSRCMTRMPSLNSIKVLLHTLSKQDNNIYEKGLNPDKGYYLLDPDDNLPGSMGRFKDDFTQKKFWKGLAGKKPNLEDLSDALNHDLLVYCGHGNGGKYVPGETLEMLPCRAASLLMGCSSGAMKYQNKLEDESMPWNYLLAGSPCIVGILWTVTDKEIDKYLTKLLDICYDSKEKCTSVSMSDAVWKARDSCRLKYLTGAAPVLFGLPVLVKFQKKSIQRKVNKN